MEIQDEYKEIFRYHDHQLIVRCPKIEIQLPMAYFDHHISEIEENRVVTFGIFDFYIYMTGSAGEKGIKKTLSYPSVMTILPSYMEVRGKGEDRYYVLELVEGDPFMNSTLVAKDSSVVKRFIQLIYSGHLPASIPYNRIAELWDECLDINGVNLNVSEPIIHMIVAEVCRNPSDYSELFRHLLRRNPKANMVNKKILRIDDIPRYNSSFAALTSADPKQGMTVAVTRKRSGKKSKTSPIEKAIL